MSAAFLSVLVAACVLYAHHTNTVPTLDTESTIRTACQYRKVPCRTFSGCCTSTTDQTWGAAGSPYLSYTPYLSSVIPTGQNLKNARVISNLLSAQSQNTVNAHGLNELWPYFALFVAHDLINTPFTGPMMPIIRAPDVGPGTPIFFRRSQRVPTGEGTKEEPVNRVSAAIDQSGVYGIDEENTKKLGKVIDVY